MPISLQPAVAGEPGVARDLGEVGIDAPRLVRRRAARAARHSPKRERTRTSAGADVMSPRRVGITSYAQVEASAARHGDAKPAARRVSRVGSTWSNSSQRQSPRALRLDAQVDVAS